MLQTDLTVGSGLTAARIVLAGRSAGVNVSVDGVQIIEQEPYDPLLEQDIAEMLPAGSQKLTVTSKGCAGPSAFFLVLRLRYADGSTQVIASDKSWTWGPASKPKPAIVHGPVSERLLIQRSRRVGVDVVDNYDQWKQALGARQGSDPASFRIAPGFEIALVRSAAENEDSWVSLRFDPQGRVIIGMEKQGLLRMTLTAQGNAVSLVERIDDTMLECRGLVFRGTDLYVNANRSRSVFRLRGDEQGNLRTPEALLETPGGDGHGRNSLDLGPDGMIYSIHGDAVNLPGDATDYTSPFRDARRGRRTKEGHVIRFDPDTLAIETLAAGLRNPFGIAFNSDGEMFTYDADAEHDMGSPWYRPTRVNHLVVGGDYGWRGVTGKWPPYYPDHPGNALPGIDIGKGSPTAVMFASHSDFPERYREALFVLDWTYGRILLVHTFPRGASYLLSSETFLQGKPLNVTGLDFAPDGSLYLVTGGRKTQSALYRVRFAAAASKSPRPSTFDTRSRNFAEAARRVRRQLESMLARPVADKDLDFAWQQLRNEDPWIRHAARNVVEHQPIDRWQQRALTEDNRLAALTALMSLARTQPPHWIPHVLSRLNSLDMTAASRSERLLRAYVYGICLPAADEELADAAEQRLSMSYPDTSYLVNQRLSEALAKLNAAAMVAPTIDMLTTTTVQQQQMHYLYILRTVTRGWTPALRERYFTTLAQARHYRGGRGMQDFLSQIQEAALSTLGPAERLEYETLLAANDRAAEMPLPPRDFVRKWTVETALGAFSAKHHPPDLKRGAQLFRAASCATCHRLAGQGTLVGPDLTAASSRYSRRDLLDSIINPSKVIAENYRSLQIVTRSGKTYVGRPALGGDYREVVLRLATNPTRPFEVTEIPKSDIQSQHTSPISWMPAGLLDTFDASEIRDLIAFIEARGQTKR